MTAEGNHKKKRANHSTVNLDKKFISEYKEFTEEDYIRLQENLIAFKQGDKEAITYIISTFHQFLTKYARFINIGNFLNVKSKAGSDKSLSRFVGLFMSSEKSNKNKTLKTSDRHRNFAETCDKIASLFSKYEYWDIYNELVCALLNMAKKYKITQEGDEFHHKNGSFHMYVNKCFHFEAYNMLSKMISDPLTHMETYSICDEFDHSELDSHGIYNRPCNGESENVASVNYIAKAYCLKDTDTDKQIDEFFDKADRKNALDTSNRLVLKEEKDLDPYDTESLNFNWTNGTTCSEVFDCLTSYERELIVLSFIQNKTDSEIARLYSCHRITIVKHKKEAVRKIKEAAVIKKLIK